MKHFLPALIISFSIISASFAQEPATDTTNKKMRLPIQKFYVGGSMDGAIFSTATIQHSTTTTNGGGIVTTVTSNTTGILRFSYFFNFGFTFNFNLNRHLGVYTGIDIKNVGYIDKNAGGETVKHRTYNIGAPVGIKIGNMSRRRNFLFLGGGADAPVNYREKSFSIRDQKTKFNEWFSDRTPAIMPYVFIGASVYRGVTLKAQYYPNNFLNPAFTVNGGQPYSGYDVHLIMFSIGFLTHYSKKHDIVTKHVAELNTM